MRRRGERATRRGGVVLLVAGLALILAATCLAGYNMWDSWRARSDAESALAQLQATMPLPDALPANLDERRAMPVAVVDGIAYVGVVEVPTLGLTLPVQASWSYAGLAVSPCLYAGSIYAGDAVVAAHNYASHFGSIGELNLKDRVVFTDVDGTSFYYEVDVVDVLDGTAVEEMTSGGWPLTLFTCTFDGSSRVTVRCNALSQ